MTTMTSTNKHGRIRTATVEPFIKNKAVRKELRRGPALVVGGRNVNRFLELAYQVWIPRRREELEEAE